MGVAVLVCVWASHTAWNMGTHTITQTLTPCLCSAGWPLRPLHPEVERSIKTHLVPTDAFLLKNCTVHLIKMSDLKHAPITGSKRVIVASDNISERTWVHVYSRCSAACSFCRICLWFQGRRSETKTWTVSQSSTFNSSSVSQHVCRRRFRTLE